MTTIAPYTLILQAEMLEFFVMYNSVFRDLKQKLTQKIVSWRIKFDWYGKFTLCFIWSKGPYLNTDFYEQIKKSLAGTMK